jgi:hypothetical protein
VRERSWWSRRTATTICGISNRRRGGRVGWATKVYGEDWELDDDAEEVEERFERWRETREDDW